MDNNGFDYGKVIAEIVMKHEEKWLNGLKGLLLDKYKKAEIKFSFAFKVYLERALEKYSKVKTILYKNSPRDLYDFFVCNDLCVENKIIECASVNGLIQRGKYSVVTGSGGTGKSILMRHFFLSALKESDLIPIFVELRNLGEEESLVDFLYRTMCNLGFSLEKSYFEFALSNGVFLLLFDGYDEMTAVNKKRFYRDIDDLCDNYNKNYVVVSSRLSDEFFGWQRFTIFRTQRLTKDKALELIERIDYDEEIKEKFLEKLDNELYRSHESFASNPLLLSIMLMTFDNFAEIPEKRHIFYANAFDTLYSIHDATKGGFKRELKSKLSSEDFKKVFSCFCFMTYLGDATEFTKDKLLSCLEKITYTPNNFDKELFVEDLVMAVCLLYIEGYSYIFTHRSFQEYFTALHLLQMNESEQKAACKFLLDNCEMSIRTDAVLEMLCDMNSDRFEQNFVIPVLEELVGRIPNSESDGKKLIPYYIERVRITSLETLLESDFDGLTENDVLLPVKGYERTKNCIIITYLDKTYPRFLNFLANHYKCNSCQVRKGNKINPKYLEKEFYASEIVRDPVLASYLMSYGFVSNSILIPQILLKKLVSQQRNKEAKVFDLFSAYLELGKAESGDI